MNAAGKEMRKTHRGQANHMTPDFSTSFFAPVPLSGMAAHITASGAPFVFAASAMIFALSLWIASRTRA